MGFDLNHLITGPEFKALILSLFGGPGIGKTTFAAGAPNPIFLATEEGANIVGATRTPLIESFDEYMDVLSALAQDDHDYKTAVTDTFNSLESLIHEAVAKEQGVGSIGDIDYGKGYVLALDKFKEVFKALRYLRDKKDMAIVILAHSKVIRFDDPSRGSYSKYELKMHDKAAAMLTEWTETLAFADYDMVIVKEKTGFNQEVSRGEAIGGRVMHFVECPAYRAKKRYNIPDTLPLNWQAFSDATEEAIKQQKQQGVEK